MTSPASGDQPAYVDPVTGQQLFVDPITGQLVYTDPATSPYPAPPTYPDQTPWPVTPPYPGFPTTADPGTAVDEPAAGSSLALPPAMTAGGYPVTGYALPYPGPAYGYGYPAPVMQRTNGLAIAALVCSIVGGVLLFCDGVGFVPALVGAILGHVARRQIRQRDEGGAGMALAGIITGWVVVGIAIILAVLVIVFFVWANNNPNFGG